MSSVELARRLGTRQPTAWLLKHKLMAAMQAREAEKPKLQGRVEIDDAYLGGQRLGGKRGRGAAGKTPFVAAVETTAERKPSPCLYWRGVCRRPETARSLALWA